VVDEHPSHDTPNCPHLLAAQSIPQYTIIGSCGFGFGHNIMAAPPPATAKAPAPAKYMNFRLLILFDEPKSLTPFG